MRCLALIFSALLACASVAQEFSVCGEDADYSPYINLQRQGILKDLIDLAAANAALTVSYYHRPWKRCLSMVKQGELDAMMAVSWTEERAKHLIYPAEEQDSPRASKRIWHSEFVIFVHNSSTIAWDGEVFSGLKAGIGTPLGYISEHRLKQLNALAANAVSLEQGLQLVARERLDGYVIERQIGWQMAKKLGLQDQMRVLPLSLLQESWYVAFSPRYYKEHAEVVSAFWHSLEQVREQQMKNIAHRYDLKSTP